MDDRKDVNICNDFLFAREALEKIGFTVKIRSGYFHVFAAQKEDAACQPFEVSCQTAHEVEIVYQTLSQIDAVARPTA